MKRYEVWSEGYLVTGMEGIPAKAHFHGEAWAESFTEACSILFQNDKYYNSKNNTYWACSLFDNKADAAKSWG